MGNLIIDRVNEAYYGVLGADFSKKTRERINWIVTHVEGNKILDIGCSQGINAILLGREGKKVDGIDISSDAIEYAKEELKKEHPSVQQSVTFRVSNFMTDHEIDSDYDTVLLTEVIEHISDPDSFLEKVSKHIKPGGKLIVTVPFGINDFIDHKRTYFYSLLAEQLKGHFSIESFTYLGKWTGVICKASSEEGAPLYTAQAVQKLENAFYEVEREYLDRIENYMNELNKYKNERQELLKEKEELEKLKILHESLIEDRQEKEELIRQLQIETVELLNKEEDALKDALIKSNKIEDMSKQINLLEHRYKVLRRSRFGRIQIKYWELKKKIAGRGKK
ncbi:methyltransferase [uncultured Metabacillus sp.]|uniref:class I SAM-dependent methyltransferase n=1 Tax=uncultured Metabacillus sp. TaxID=2860135 RepID=UPI00262A21A5|nr:methyltransferase [uncultured Metabacillus sp.]